MQLYIQYIDHQGAVLIQECVRYPAGQASEQELRDFARKHLETLNLSQRCAAALKGFFVFTVAASDKFA